MGSESNYDVFKREALKRYITFDQEAIIRRLLLDSDDTYIYLSFCSTDYRIHKTIPCLERKETVPDSETVLWEEADCNEVLSICDLLCHTDRPIRLSGTDQTLEGLSRLKSGSGSSTLGQGFFSGTARCFDDKVPQLRAACEQLKGNPAGKGDVAYQIPLYGDICLRFQFYQSDDEFDASITIFFDADICEYLHYETLYYIANLVFDKLKRLCGLP